MVAFYVLGLPVPEGELNCNRQPNHKLYHANTKRLIPWRNAIAAAARRHAADVPVGPIELELTFSMGRPKNHYGTGRNAKTLKPTAPIWHTVKPDVDHLVRAVLDALTQGGVYLDDSVVVDVHGRKFYAEDGLVNSAFGDVLAEPGVVVRIRPAGENQ